MNHLDSKTLTILLIAICMMVMIITIMIVAIIAIKLRSLKTENNILHNLSNIYEEQISVSNNIIEDQKRIISLQEEIINEQKGEIRALEYTSKYPLFTSNVSVRDRKAGR